MTNEDKAVSGFTSMFGGTLGVMLAIVFAFGACGLTTCGACVGLSAIGQNEIDRAAREAGK